MSLVKFKRRGFPWLDNDNFFENDFIASSRNLPAMNVKDNPKNIEIEMAVPGFSKKEMEVSLENGILHVSAEKSKEEKTGDEDYTRKEFEYSSFDRKLQIPPTVDQGKEVVASYKDGILKLKLAKKNSVIEHPKKVIKIS
ncbi:HSP20 family protein [Gillisia sp. Hel_I_86]|uniref:Hsp20/alpha crystallin family protein n=1 Tax=Gillisia sp. Hel_I_86 TaxID=1249981 RepID=UPI00119C12B2|nr:Hsp20/alpha crystallin family protein [Gillisia sp. Hel_I_86]TVZ27570.1 HSP20 family protein [Gillisia sp. Hel_I_86]